MQSHELHDGLEQEREAQRFASLADSSRPLSRRSTTYRGLLCVAVAVVSCLEMTYGVWTHAESTPARSGIPESTGAESAVSSDTDSGPNPRLVQPKKQSIPKVKIAEAVGWSEGGKPHVAAGFVVNAYAKDLNHPRWLYVLPNGDVLVAETNAPPNREDRKGVKGWFMTRAMRKAGAAIPSPNRILLLRDTDRDGVAETRSVFLSGLNSPFGMALIRDELFVANTDAILKFQYTTDAMELTAQGMTVSQLPAGKINHHWTKNIIASEDGTKLYATIGSNSNVAEFGMDNEVNRAAILEVDLRDGSLRPFATGLRNPNGMDWHPTTHALWTVVNERDEIGDLLVPDYLTSVRRGGFYGWPYSYYGSHIDERVKPQDPTLVASAIAPDYAVGAHTASLGLVFYRADERAAERFPQRYRNGAFIGQHGSWNRSQFAGYKIVFLPFSATGSPAGPLEDFLTGFVEQDKAMGRPVGVVIDRRGALLVADDVGNRIWRVVPEKAGIDGRL